MSILWMRKISYLQQHPWKSVVPPLHCMAQAWWGTSHMLRCLPWVLHSGFFQTCLYIRRDTRNGTRTGADWKFWIMSPEYWHSLAFFSRFPGFRKRQQTSWLWRSYKLLEIARNKQMGTKPHNMSTGTDHSLENSKSINYAWLWKTLSKAFLTPSHTSPKGRNNPLILLSAQHGERRTASAAPSSTEKERRKSTI